nr:excinuclease ABC subunit UvrC [Acanthopleuribacter pedis]
MRKQLNELPTAPGVYLFSDKKRKLLYVGKARNLRARVRSYFQKSLKSPRIERMIAKIDHLEIVITQTESEALLLENSLIKNNKPHFNVLLRDDKTYPYIRITKEPFPRVTFTRRRRKKDDLYGPFPNAKAARQAIKLMHQHFKVRNCDLKLGEKEYRPCLQYHIKRCDAPCAFLVDEATYLHGIDRARLFLQGKRDDLVVEISSQMKTAAAAFEYERAAYFRDLLGLVTRVQLNQQVANLSYSRLDVVIARVEGWEVAILITVIRGGAVVRSAQFKVDLEDEAVGDVAKWLTHYYLNHEDPPDEIVVEKDEGLAVLGAALAAAEKRAIQVTVPQRGTKKRLLTMTEETLRANLELQAAEKEEHPGVVQLADALALSQLPKRMECFDISNTQGTHSVASMVSFFDGRPDKKNYRKFNIKTVEGPNDFASMAEVVGRRYRRLLSEGKDLPDLIIVDGGLGQLHAAHEVLQGLGLGDHPLIGLAKREELIYRTHTNEPVAIPHHEPALRLMQHIRNEAHRFGITFHRSKRAKAMIHSELEEIPGLGPTRIKKLLHHFGSVRRIRDADQAQLAQIVGPRIAQTIREHLR